MNLPRQQRAIRLTGPNELVFVDDKEVYEPNDYQILCKVKVVGLCFSDLKLLKQFDRHPRKRPVQSGADPELLAEIPSYVPDKEPTVPGHEPVVEVVHVGSKVTRVKPGERYFIQADWRWLDTGQSKGALGYNFEGALQEYVLLDERVILSPDGQSVLMSADDDSRSIAAYGLIEPWACVEYAYRVTERTTTTEGGTIAVVIDPGISVGQPAEQLRALPKPKECLLVEATADIAEGWAESARELQRVSDLPDGACNDILYFGADADTAEQLFDKLAPNGLLVLMTCDRVFEREVVTALGKVHYGGLRIVGTTSDVVAQALNAIPATGEIRPNDRIHVVGAGGPMGVMHIVRNICQGVEGASVYGSDLSDERLQALSKLASPIAEERGVECRLFNPKTLPVDEAFNYISIMAPVPALVAQAVHDAADGAVINIFAGIAAGVTGPMDLNTYVDKGLYMIGTSGSDISDMQVVLGKVQSGQLDTNVSVAAVSGLEGAIEGIRAVERQEIPGKILVYPECPGLELTLLTELEAQRPEVAAALRGGVWTLEAEQALLAAYADEAG